MKETLRQRLESLKLKLSERMKMLDENITSYVEKGSLGDAAINQIKRDTISLISEEIDKILQ